MYQNANEFKTSLGKIARASLKKQQKKQSGAGGSRLLSWWR
jgi:hypothetical protein